MSDRKKRILFVGEASFLSTGFAVYYRELIPRLIATGKYEIAEIGSYARQDHPLVKEFIQDRWKFYGVMPTTQQEQAAFNQPSQDPRDYGQNINQFGAGVFDRAVADFQPDIVIDIRDNWMLTWQLRSPFRNWFKLLWMPTVDAEPQKEEWIRDYEKADMILSYSDYGIDTLKRQSETAKVFPQPMRPGVDLETFYPMDRKAVREEFCIAEDIPIIGTVMRNQSRKLFPDLIDAFSLMKKKYEGEERVDKAVLLVHSAWPDNQYSYDYPRHVMRLHSYEWMPYHFKGLKNHVMQSLMCHNCGKKSLGWVINLYGRPAENNLIKLPCMFCQQNTATCPTTGYGYEREDLAKLYNMMDLYVQCTICEGDGMPIQEAKACGVPTLVMDYTAMREKGRVPEYNHIKSNEYSCHEGGETIDVGRYYYEPETSCKRALPNVEDLALKMRNMINDPQKLKTMGDDARKCVETNYDWDKLIKNWEFVLDGVKPKDRSKTWDTPIQVTEVKDNYPTAPEGLSDSEFVDWLYINILEYNRVDVDGAKMWLQHLQQGLTRERLYQQFVDIGKRQAVGNNVREQIRADIARSKGEYVDEAKTKQEWL